MTHQHVRSARADRPGDGAERLLPDAGPAIRVTRTCRGRTSAERHVPAAGRGRLLHVPLVSRSPCSVERALSAAGPAAPSRGPAPRAPGVQASPLEAGPP